MSYVIDPIRKIKFVDIIEGNTVATLEIDEEFTGRTPDAKTKELCDQIFHRLTKTYSPQRLRVIEE